MTYSLVQLALMPSFKYLSMVHGRKDHVALSRNLTFMERKAKIERTIAQFLAS